MKNWLTLEADVVCLLNRRFTRGRAGASIEFVTVHHNAGINTVEDLWRLWTYEREASAHYQVESRGRIGQLVWDQDTAWHAANQWANRRSIAVEVSNSGGPAQDWPIDPVARREAARLVAAVCLYYRLGRPVAGKNVRFHKEFSSTSCPYHLAPGGKYHAEFMAEAQRFYDELARPPRHAAPETDILLTGVSAAALHEMKVHSIGADQRAARVEESAERTIAALSAIADQLVGPDQTRVAPEYRNPNGGRGWKSLGTNSHGQWLTPVDALACLKTDIESITPKKPRRSAAA